MYVIKTLRFKTDFSENSEVSGALGSQVDSDISGKQKIFYFGHPKDAEQYFELISKDILDIEDCAIFYIDEAEEYAPMLGEMNLFAAAVSGNFVCEKTPFINDIMNFAKEHNKPVLPIMTEPGLENLFNDAYGNIQLLDRNSGDVTQISYKDKLTNYLRAVLVDVELVNKIKNEFNSSIFLSYRKKDREHAQKLMKLIHDSSIYRDVAIWYDEFLVPGDNFLRSIDDALDKSSVFALAVTPNILEEREIEPNKFEPNFVMGTEYPRAKKRWKKIFPAELVPTDKDELNEKFPGLPKCVNVNDRPAFINRLAAVLGVAPNPGRDTPEHKFLIGLAYLNGIDVEQNADHAFRLMFSSASEEYPPAMKHLANMYKTGNGANVNSGESLRWQEKYAEYLKGKYDNSGSEEDGCAYIEYLVEMCGYCEDNLITGDLERFERVSSECEAFIQKFNSLKTRTLRARCFECLSRIYDYADDLEKAVKCAEKADEEYENIMLETYNANSGLEDGILELSVRSRLYKEAFYEVMRMPDNEYTISFDRIKKELNNRMRMLQNLSRVYRRAGNKEGARNTASVAVSFATAIYFKCGQRLEDKNVLAECYMTLADVFFEDKEYGQARPHYGEAMKIFKEKYNEDQSISSQISLLTSLFKLANAYRDDDRKSIFQDKAEDRYLEAVKQAEDISQKTTSLKTVFILAQCYINAADLYTRIISSNCLRYFQYVSEDLRDHHLNLAERLFKPAFEYDVKYRECVARILNLAPQFLDNSEFVDTLSKEVDLYTCHSDYELLRFPDKIPSDDLLHPMTLLRYIYNRRKLDAETLNTVLYKMYVCCNNLCMRYKKAENFPEEFNYQREALDLALRLDNKQYILNEYVRMGDFCFRALKYGLALENYKKAFEYISFCENPEMRSYLQARRDMCNFFVLRESESIFSSCPFLTAPF